MFLNRYNMNATIRILSVTVTVLLLCSQPLRAQKWSIGTNLLDYANFLTINAEAGVSLHQHWSLTAEGRYNPFYFQGRSRQIQNKKLAISAGARYWPFFVYSGFYYGARLQWCRYSSGGIFSQKAREGDAFGMGLNFGYSLMLTKHLNIEFGIGLWFGGTTFREYRSLPCGKLTDWGTKAFIAPDDIQINILYYF